ncbi:hypothetical protein [Reyranella sp.]|uniref:hypothetical protein n=1 Tax=Reyranella sp. TaxID=1929291 RepID=UPI003783FEF8
MRATGLVRRARAAGVGAIAAALLTGCSKIDRHVTVYQTDDRGGLYPADTSSGEPTYHVGWRIFR